MSGAQYAPKDSQQKTGLVLFSPKDLIPAEENRLLYEDFTPNADKDDRDLYFSIKENGIMNPLIVSADMYILSGHRRHAVAHQWLRLATVPCLVHDDIVFAELTADERVVELAKHNQQRDKSHAERLREAMLEDNPVEAYERLIMDRASRHHQLEDNVILGAVKTRAKITTKAFPDAAIKAVMSEKDFWPVTARRIHYLMLNDPPLRHDKKPDSTYQNDLNSYKALTNLLVRMRLTGLIPPGAVEDETRPCEVPRTYQSPEDYIKECADNFARWYERTLLRGQRNHVEILVEKNAIRTHVERVAKEYTIPCTTGRGYSSLTPRWNMVKRFKASGKERLVLLILSDFDPDGEEIARAFPRSLRDDFGLSNVISRKVLLSGDDVREHGLPFDMDAKETSPNYKKFVALHGTHVAELDAAPVALIQGKLRDAIEGYLDMELFRAELAIEKDDDAVVIDRARRIIRKALAA